MEQNYRYLTSELQNITLHKEYSDKSILDIGGGGEGFIGNIYGRKVISIDHREDELLETNNESIKLVMDAADLKFTAEKFDVVTVFYSLLYMNRETKEKVISEAFRVLKPGGVIDVWDIEIPEYDGSEKDIFIAKLKVNYADQEIESGYGITYEGYHHCASFIKSLLKKAGFKKVLEETSDQSFRLKYQKE